MREGETAPTPLLAKPNTYLGHILTTPALPGMLCSLLPCACVQDCSSSPFLALLSEMFLHLSSLQRLLKFLPASMFWEAKAGLDSSFGLKIAYRLSGKQQILAEHPEAVVVSSEGVPFWCHPSCCSC